VTAELGASAAITTTGTSPWENEQKVNDPDTPRSSSPGTGVGWGNWGQQLNGTSLARAAWIQYAWDSPVRLASTDIYWYDDNGGVRRPTASTWAIESSTNGTDWTPVDLTNGSTYASALNVDAYNHLDFAPITAQFLRIRIFGVMGDGAGSGVLRWRANAEQIDSVRQPVLIRTTVGQVPTLPSRLDVTYVSGAHGTADFRWEEITPDMVAESNVDPFVVHGVSDLYGAFAEARIYVRPESEISIQDAESFVETTRVGEQPFLPDKVAVSYNDGSRDNQAVGVDWDYDPSVVDSPGTHTIVGQLVLPDYVSTAGTTQTTLTLTVVAADST
jgi:hypothetical protein